MSEDKWLSFERNLEEHHAWPCRYLFKFIVAQAGVEAVQDLFPGVETALRPSSTGKYVSVSAEVLASSAAEVVAVYRKAEAIPGIVSL